jgi:hypothetical protein
VSQRRSGARARCGNTANILHTAGPLVPVPGTPGSGWGRARVWTSGGGRRKGGIISYQVNALRLLRQSRWPFARTTS